MDPTLFYFTQFRRIILFLSGNHIYHGVKMVQLPFKKLILEQGTIYQKNLSNYAVFYKLL